jgi:hypothetical protein
MAIDLPTLVQRVRVDTSGLSKAEAQAKSFASTMQAASKDIDSSTTKLAKDTEAGTKATERSNAAHRETPGSVGPATSAIREHISANREHTATSNASGAATRRHARDHDALGNSVRKSTAEMKKAKTDSKVLGGVFKNLAKVMAPGMIVGIASFVSPLLTLVNSLGAGAIAVAGSLGQMASAFAATGAAAVGSLAQVSGVAAALPGIAGALLTGVGAVKATFKGMTGTSAGYDAAVKSASAATTSLSAAEARYQQVATNPKATAAQKASAKAALDAAKARSTAANTAVAKFGPTASTMAAEVKVYKDAFKDMGDITRSITVPAFVEGMKAAAPALGVFKTGAKQLAQEIAPLARSLGQFVGSKGFLRDLSTLATNNAKVFGQLGGALKPAAGAFTNIAVAAAPMTLALAGAVRQFAVFFEKKTEDRGGMTAFFNRAAVQAVALAKSIGNVISVIIRIGSIGSSVFFGTKGLAGGILESTTRLNTWVKSGAGVAKITGYFQRMKPIAENTFGAIVNFGAGLINLAKIGSNVFFGTGGMSGGIADVAKKFNDWTKSPGGIQAITGYFQEMKPVVSEAMLLLKQVLVDMFSLGRDKSTASMLQMIRTDFLPIVTQMLQKMSAMAPAVLSTLKGVADFAGSLDPTVILAVANAFGTMVSNIGTLISIIPGLGTVVSLLLAYLSARKLLGGVLVPLLGLAGGKGGIVSTLLGGATTAGGTLRAGGVAAGAAMEASAATAAETLRLGAVGGGKGGKVASAAGTAATIGPSVVGGGGKMAVLSSAAKVALRGAIWAAIGYMIGDTIVNLTAAPAAKQGETGAKEVTDAKTVWEKSDKGPAAAATYTKALQDGAAKIKSSSDGLGGALLYGISNVGTGVANFFGGTNKRNLSQAQKDAVAAIDKETAQVKLETDARRAAWLMTPAGKKWQAQQDAANAAKNKEAAKPKNAEQTLQARYDKDVTDAKAIVAKYEKDKAARWRSTYPKNRINIEREAPPPEVARARKLIADAAKAEAEEARQRKIAAQIKTVGWLKDIADYSAQQAAKRVEGPGGRRYDPRLQDKANADAAKLRAAQEELNRLRGIPTGTNRPQTGIPTTTPTPPGTATPLTPNQTLVATAARTAATVQAALARIPGMGTAADAALQQKLVLGLAMIPPAMRPQLTSLNAGVENALAGLPASVRAAVGLPPLDPNAWFVAGKGLTQKLADGLNAGLSHVIETGAAISNGLSMLFGGSPVEAGPLVSFNNGKAGLGLADKLAVGLDKGRPRVTKAASGLAASVAATTIPQMRGTVTSPFTPKPAAAEVAGGAAAPRPVQFHIGTVEDGDTLLRRARATDRMMSLAEGGDSMQMRGIGI